MGKKRFTRGAGILLSITSLPSAYGIGTLGEEAFRFVDLLVDLKQRYWQVLPIGPTSFGDSPYQSFSAFAGNPYMIDLDDLVKDGLLKREEIGSYNWGSDEHDINYAVLYNNRFRVLEQAYGRFDRKNTDFLSFCEKKKEWLEDYSLFMAIKTESEGKEWLSFHKELREHEAKAVSAYKRKNEEKIDFWKFCQYKFFIQWSRFKSYANSRGIEIIGDVPLYVALDSADVWGHRGMFQLGPNGVPDRVAGCPPDAYSADGQKWGNPLYDWKQIEKENFCWWRMRMKENAGLYDALRIDNFSGLLKYYSIPFEKGGVKDGKWEKGPGKKLLDIMEEESGECKIMAEDLGPCVPAVKKMREKMEWPGMKVLLFAFDGDISSEYLPHNYIDRNTVVYAGTHDNETIVGSYRDKTEYELAFLYEYLNIDSKDAIPDAFIRLAYSSIADVVILQMQDILKLGNEARMNHPSTVGSNWRWRVWHDCLSEERRTWIRTISTIYRR